MDKSKIILTVLVIIFIGQLLFNLQFLLKPKTDNGQEIERKFLIKTEKIPYDLNKLERYSFTQAYLNFSPEIRIRNIDDDLFILTVKAAVDDKGMVREEREFNITKDEYMKLLAKKEGNIITKDRYYFAEKGQLMSIDIYTGDLKGLAVLEIEFKTKEEAEKFTVPIWVEKEVTEDKNYKNGNLAKSGLKI